MKNFTLILLLSLLQLFCSPPPAFCNYCTYTISPRSHAFSASEGSGTIEVSTQSGCNWVATASDDWITVTAGNSGTGNGTVFFAVAANSSGQSRKSAIKVEVAAATIRQAKSTFADGRGDVYDPYIYGIYSEGITTGCGNNSYCPRENVTRGQMAAFIIRSLYGEDFSYTQAPYFEDVPASNVFFKYVQKLKDTGTTAAVGRYMVDDAVTREQMAAFIVRALFGENFSHGATPFFSDVPSTSVYFKYVQMMKQSGITAATDSYAPATPVTREQMAAFLGRAFLGMDSPVLSHTEMPYLRGMSIGGNWGGNIDDFKTMPDSFVQALVADNVNWVGIKLPIFNESISDPTVRVKYRPSSDTDYSHMYSFNDSDLITAVTKLKQKGMNVYLSLALTQPYPEDESLCRTARYGVDAHLQGDTEPPSAANSPAWGYQCIDPSLWWWSPSHADHAANVAAFWRSYTEVAVKYARMAQQLGVGMFALGEESDRLFRTRSTPRFPNNYKNELSALVNAVRAEYKGLLTYGQQSFVHVAHPEWWGLDAAAGESLFKDLGLDVVGISGYYSLVNAPVDRVFSLAELERGWHAIFTNYLVPLQARNPDIPMVFTDAGFVDSVDAPWDPLSQGGDLYIFSDANGNGIDDGREQQANMFRSLLNVNESFGHLLRGTIFAWSLVDTNANIAEWYRTHRDIQIHGKPAEQVIREEYGQLK